MGKPAKVTSISPFRVILRDILMSMMIIATKAPAYSVEGSLWIANIRAESSPAASIEIDINRLPVFYHL